MRYLSCADLTGLLALHKNTVTVNKNAELLDGRRSGDAESADRRQAVTELVRQGQVGSQAELASLLASRGFTTTQATLSRDLKALGIGKVPAPEHGYVYVLPGNARSSLGVERPTLEIEAFVRRVELVGNLVLVRTPPGNAQGVARAIDNLDWPEVAGTVSGDDTILIVTRDLNGAEKLRERFTSVCGRRF